jgi:hypothetical protein
MVEGEKLLIGKFIGDVSIGVRANSVAFEGLSEV